MTAECCCGIPTKFTLLMWADDSMANPICPRRLSKSEHMMGPRVVWRSPLRGKLSPLAGRTMLFVFGTWRLTNKQRNCAAMPAMCAIVRTRTTANGCCPGGVISKSNFGSPTNMPRQVVLNDTSGDAVLAAHFSHDGEQVVTASRDRTASLWDVESHALVRQFAEGHEFLASTAVFFDDGARLATGGGDGTVRIWDVATGTQLEELYGTGYTAALAVSPDGQWLATGSTGNDAQVWNAATGEQVALLAGHEGANHGLAVF